MTAAKHRGAVNNSEHCEQCEAARPSLIEVRKPKFCCDVFKIEGSTGKSKQAAAQPTHKLSNSAQLIINAPTHTWPIITAASSRRLRHTRAQHSIPPPPPRSTSAAPNQHHELTPPPRDTSSSPAAAAAVDTTTPAAAASRGTVKSRMATLR